MSDGWQFEAQYAMHMYYEKDGELEQAKRRIEQLERELQALTNDYDALRDCFDDTVKQIVAEKALADDLDGGLKVAQDIIEAASKQLTKKSGTKWGLWHLDRISELRAAHCKARGL